MISTDKPPQCLLNPPLKRDGCAAMQDLTRDVVRIDAIPQETIDTVRVRLSPASSCWWLLLLPHVLHVPFELASLQHPRSCTPFWDSWSSACFLHLHVHRKAGSTGISRPAVLH
jgi:hypothetical protein